MEEVQNDDRKKGHHTSQVRVSHRRMRCCDERRCMLERQLIPGGALELDNAGSFLPSADPSAGAGRDSG
jgi:hypothetical protein